MKISVGMESFDTLRRSGYYYVDKTDLIYDLVNANNAVTLFTRPRRFGKTLAMSMLESFFDISRDSRDVFEGLKITSNVDFCDAWMNQYPVIFISFKDVEGLDFSTAFIKLRTLVAEICKKNNAVIEGNISDEDDLVYYKTLKSEAVNEATIQNSLYFLTRILSSVYAKPVILLIDEYDVPLAKAREQGYYPQMLDVIRGMFSVALKTNEYLKFGVVTGCLRISKESIFTGVNNFTSYSVLKKRFSGYFGFTDDEIQKMLKDTGVEDKAELIRRWYDGYVFGNSAVYCPWDVISYLSDLMDDEEAQPQNYWKNTSGNGVLRTFIEETDYNVSDKFETLMNGGTIRQNISEELTYDQLYRSEDNLWSVLLMTGYLTKADPNEQGSNVSLRIPNAEISSIFQDTVVVHFRKELSRDAQQELMKAFWAEDEVKASELLSDLLWQTISYNDYHEDYYHAFLAGIFVGLGYSVESNKEHGIGRPDIVLKDRKNRRALIIEAKRSETADRMDFWCDEAINQIRREKYWRELDGYRTIPCYGVSFFKKDALVKKMNSDSQ